MSEEKGDGGEEGDREEGRRKWSGREREVELKGLVNEVNERGRAGEKINSGSRNKERHKHERKCLKARSTGVGGSDSNDNENDRGK